MNRLQEGEQYDVSKIALAGWSEGDGSGSEGYFLADYFEADGTYKGADWTGIEPLVEVS